MPLLLGIASLVLFLSCLPLLDRNAGYTPMDPSLTARAVEYVEDENAAEGQRLQLQLMSHGRPLGTVTVRDDRPWCTVDRGDEVRLLIRPSHVRRGPDFEYIVADFAAKWGGLLARSAAAVLCDMAAVAALLLARRRPSAALRFPPPVPRAG